MTYLRKRFLSDKSYQILKSYFLIYREKDNKVIYIYDFIHNKKMCYKILYVY